MFLEFISLFFIIATSLVGIASIIWNLCSWLFDRQLCKRAVVVLPVKGSFDNAEYKIKCCLHYLKGEGLPLVVVDFGLDEASRTTIAQLAEEQAELRLILPEALPDCLKDAMDTSEKA